MFVIIGIAALIVAIISLMLGFYFRHLADLYSIQAELASYLSAMVDRLGEVEQTIADRIGDL